MADKQFPLSIVLGLVDKATAGVVAVNKRLDEATKPTRELGKAFGELNEKSGLGKVADGFAGVGGAVKDVLGKLLLIGGAAGGVVVAFAGLVGSFDDLGDLAERIGVSVDFLASMRYAAERSGASVESLDQGLQAFTQNLGAARAGTGRMTAFLKLVSPALLEQLKHTKSNEEAFDLLATAMAKIEDPAKRLALAQKTVGDGALAPLLARGGKGIEELRKRYIDLAGSQEGAAGAAGKVDDSMKDLKAATDGIKAALVEGLSPALGQIVEELRAWFAENRERIAEWATALGKKLPAAIHRFADAFLNALDTVGEIIDKIGGVKTVALVLAGVIVGPLVASLYALGAAILTTPVGWILAGLAAITLAGYELVKHWDAVAAFFKDVWSRFGGIITAALPFIVIPVRLLIGLVKTIIDHWEPIAGFFSALWGGVTAVFSKAWDIIKAIADKIVGVVETVSGAISTVIDTINPFADSGPSKIDVTNQAINTVNAAHAIDTVNAAKVTVDFANAPRGTRVTADPQNKVDVDMTVGFQMGGFW